MSIHSLAPGYARLTYSGWTLPHHAIYPIKPSTPFVAGIEPSLLTRDESTRSLTGFVGELMAVLKPFFAEETVFSTIEVYAQDDADTPPTFIYGQTLVDQVGTNVGTNQQFVESVFTYRTVGGNPFKMYLMECVNARNFKLSIASLGEPTESLNEYLLADNCCIFGRDGTPPLFGLNVSTKENDVLRRRFGL